MTAAGAPARGFHHAALPYAGAGDLADRAAPIISGAVAAGDPVLVAVDAAMIGRLRDRLGNPSRSVVWKDVRDVGGNPARILPLWREFLGRHLHSERVLGLGEPVWAGRGPAELVEAQRHEELLNLAFAGASNFTLLCPYDTERLEPAVLAEARRNHPFLVEDEGSRASADYMGLPAISRSFAAPLAEPGAEPARFVVDRVWSGGLHGFLARLAREGGLGVARADDLALAIAATADGLGRPGAEQVVFAWREAGRVLAELRDLVAVDDPLAGREWPPPAPGPARALWLANQLCDLVQVRSTGSGALVRLHAGR